MNDEGECDEGACELFVLLVSYRDADLPHTLHALFAHAARPLALRVGVCWQADARVPRDAAAVRGPPAVQLAPRHAARVSEAWLAPRQAAGPWLARRTAIQQAPKRG